VKNLFFKGFFFCLAFTHLKSEEYSPPNDQLLVIFGSSGYVLYKSLDFANDHGFRYFKILSYEFKGFEHEVTGICKSDRKQGLFFELKDDNATIGLLCFEEKPNDTYIIDVEKYRSLLEEVDQVDD